jgi:hypothetical protein
MLIRGMRAVQTIVASVVKAGKRDFTPQKKTRRPDGVESWEQGQRLEIHPRSFYDNRPHLASSRPLIDHNYHHRDLWLEYGWSLKVPVISRKLDTPMAPVLVEWSRVVQQALC